ncbi:MAG: hypothetical protein HY293_09880 [Planctomycetes bacterium]|nr:hypothetical protein [Planctomycetota bacterium]
MFVRIAFFIAAPILAAVLVSASTQDKPGCRSGVLNVRDCMDKAKNVWMADIEAELQKLQEAESGRATDLNPQERARIRTKLLDISNKKRLEVYAEIVRLSGVVAKERGLDLVQRADRMPAVEGAEADILAQIDRRQVVYSDPSVDLTSEVIDRINRQHADKKK